MNLTMITGHIDCLQSVPPFLLDLSSLALSQNDPLTSAVGFAARSSRVLTQWRWREQVTACILHVRKWTKTFNVQKSTKPLNFSPSPKMARNLLRETPQRKPKAERGKTSSFQPRYFHSGENKTTKHTKDLNELLAQVTNNLNYYFITWLA